MPTADDHERFTRLLLEHEPRILRYVLMFVPNHADGREIVQETAVAMWRQFAEFDPDRSFATWARGFARVQIMRFRRSEQRRQRLSQEATDALILHEENMKATEWDEREAFLNDCLQSLPGAQRQLLEDYYFQHVSVESLAVSRSQTVAAVYKSLQRIRQSLLTCIEKKLSREDYVV